MNPKPSPVNPLLEGLNQRPYEFHLDNTAFGTSAEGVIYRDRAAGDANILVLTLTNSSGQAFKLAGGTMPASNDFVSEPPPPPPPHNAFPHVRGQTTDEIAESGFAGRRSQHGRLHLEISLATRLRVELRALQRSAKLEALRGAMSSKRFHP